MIPYANCKYFSSLYELIHSCFPHLSQLEVRDVLRQLMLSPKDATIKIGETPYSKSEIIDILARMCGAEASSEDLANRYAQLLESTLNTIKHMNDGYISEEDYAERTEFLKNINQKEFQLFILLALYNSQYSTPNIDKETVLIYKIKRLRELSDIINKYTRDEVGTKIDVDEYERAKIIYKMLKSLQSLGYGYTVSQKERQNLEIDHEEDDDLSPDFAYEDWIKYLMVRQLHHEDKINGSTVTNTISDLCHNDEKFGYATTLFDDLNGKIAELRGSLQKRRFDSGRFHVLEENNK